MNRRKKSRRSPCAKKKSGKGGSSACGKKSGGNGGYAH